MLKPSYQAVEDVISNSEAEIGAAEAHGMLTGMLCVNGTLDREQWLSEVFGEGRDDLSIGELATMNELGEETQRLLDAVDFSFELFLPDDEAPLSERALALSAWCQGFLYGVGYAGGGRDWPGDSAEILRDLAEISQLDTHASGEEDEAAFSEISEFVRVGVQLIRGELWQQASPKSRLH